MTYLRDAPTTFPGAGLPTSRAEARSPRKTTRSKAPKRKAAKRGKPPCKYGPRDADGYCPKKPKAPPRERADAWEDELPQAPKPPKPKRQTRAEAAAKRRLNSAVERTIRTGVTKGGTKILKSKAAARAGAAAVKAGRYLGSSVTALSGAGAAGAVGLAIAAGVAAFMGTRGIINRYKAAKERRQEAAFQAAMAMRKTRLDAEARLGRPLTVAELAKIKAAFQLDDLMRKAGL